MDGSVRLDQRVAAHRTARRPGRGTGAVLLLIALVLLTRMPALTHLHPIDDEAVYGVVANEMVAGGLPYRDAVERKPPLLFATYAAVFTVAGRSNWLALHLVATAWLAATMAGLWLLGRSVFSWRAGVAAAAAYGVFQAWATWRNLAFNGEVLMNLPLVWAWALTLGPRRRPGRMALVAAGALSCAAALLKQPAGIAALPLVAYLWQPAYRAARGLTWHDSLRQTIAFASGAAAVLATTVVVLAKHGILADAVYWTIGDHDVPHVFWMRALLFTLAFVGACLPLLIGAALALRAHAVWRDRDAERVALIGLLIVSAMGTAASGRFYPHYYIQMLPPLAWLAGAAYAGVVSGAIERPTLRRALPSVQAWVMLSALTFAAVQSYSLAQRREPSASGAFVQLHARADDRIFVWGQAAQVYLDADRRPASRYIATFPLTGYIFGGPLPGVNTRSRILPGAWDTLQHDFAAHPPAFIVDREAGPDALYPLRTFPVLAAIVGHDFEAVLRTDQDVVYERRSRLDERRGLSPSDPNDLDR